MIKTVLYILAAYFFLTGVYIFLAPETFYRLTPGLAEMGPYNFHFIRDVALTFFASGGAIAFGASSGNRPVVIAGATWPFMHALFHLQIWGHRGFPLDQVWLVDTLAVILPGLLVLVLAMRWKLPPR